MPQETKNLSPTFQSRHTLWLN